MNITINYDLNITRNRENKGKSLLKYDVNDYTIIDIETTGLDSYFNEIIELGAIKVRNNQIVDTYQTLIKPVNKIDEFIEQLTHITNEMVVNAPSLKEKLKEYIDFIGNDIIVGHNVNFDINFIYDNCLENYDNVILKNDFIDTLRLGRRCIKDVENHKLNTLAIKYNLDTENEHRAISYCILTFKLFNIEKELINNNLDCLKTYNRGVKSSDITCQTTNIDETNPFYQKEVVFTGKLDKFQRKDAMQIIANLGGINCDSVTKRTNYLILGNTDYCSNVKGNKTTKIKEAEKKKLNGQDIEIISENVFYDLITDFI